MFSAKFALLFFFLLLSIFRTYGVFYLPGVAPHDFQPGELLAVKVNKLTSTWGLLPVDYYSLPFCRPKKIYDKVESLGEILAGDRIHSFMELPVGVDIACQVQCVRQYTPDEISTLAEMVKNNYRVNWVIDNIPAAVEFYVNFPDPADSRYVYDPGFPLGGRNYWWSGNSEVTGFNINNHLNIRILYNTQSGRGMRIVGAVVSPQSIAYGDVMTSSNAPDVQCTSSSLNNAYAVFTEQRLQSNVTEIMYTYSVKWVASEVLWSHRWDKFLDDSVDTIQWTALANSVILLLFLTAVVAVMLRRGLADSYAYCTVDDEQAEISNWKLIQGDVFRAPLRPMLLSVLVGSGMQLFYTAALVLVFALLGFLAPGNRGGLLTAVILLYMVFGTVGGFYSTRVYVLCGGESWAKNVVMTSVALPGLVLTLLAVMNSVFFSVGTTLAIPADTFVSIILLWVLSLGMGLVGSLSARRKPFPANPVPTHNIPRKIPKQPFYYNNFFAMLCGIIPFGVIFIEFFFLLLAIWGNRYYYGFGTLAINFVMLAFACAMMSVVCCFTQLSKGDYNWWWRSFLTSSASGLYALLYVIFFFNTKLSVTTWGGTVAYFGYSAIFVGMLFLMTGAIGFLACYYFVRKIYSTTAAAAPVLAPLLVISNESLSRLPLQVSYIQK